MGRRCERRSLINERFCDLHNRLGLKDLGMWIGRGGIRRGDQGVFGRGAGHKKLLLRCKDCDSLAAQLLAVTLKATSFAARFQSCSERGLTTKAHYY